VDEVYAIETTPRSGGASVSLQLRSGQRYVLAATRLSELGLAGGDPVDGETVARLTDAALEWRSERRLLRLLAQRPRSRAELERRLAAWDLPERMAQGLLDRLMRAGLLDDDRMAREVSGSLRRRGHGSRRAADDLERLGVGEAAAAAAVRDHADDDGEIAAALLTERFGPQPYDPPTMRRAAGLLGRRGFDTETIAQLLGYDDP